MDQAAQEVVEKVDCRPVKLMLEKHSVQRII